MKYDANCGKHNDADKGKGNKSSDKRPDPVFHSRTNKLGNDDLGCACKSHDQECDQVRDISADRNRRKAGASYDLSYNDHVCNVVNNLQNIC